MCFWWFELHKQSIIYFHNIPEKADYSKVNIVTQNLTKENVFLTEMSHKCHKKDVNDLAECQRS